MIRATTPTHTFTFDSDPSAYSRILVTYSQNNRVVLEKEKSDLTIEERQTTEGTEYVAWFRLTQEEANRFSSSGSSRAYVQVRVLTTANEALASDITAISVKDVLNDEVLV